MKLMCETCGEVQCAYVEGYAVGDRLLEGVMFRASRIKGQDSFTVKATPEALRYFETLGIKATVWERRIAAWLNDDLENIDTAECVECGGDIEAEGIKRREPVRIGIESAAAFTAKFTGAKK